MASLSTPLATQLGLTKSGGRDFIRSTWEIDRYPNAHALRRAWDRMGLCGILCVSGKPTAYFKELERIRPSDIRRYQRFVWNQGIATLLIVSTPDEIQVYSGNVLPAADDEDPTAQNRLVQCLNRTADALEVRQLVQRIETGRIYQDHPESFDRDQAVDQCLLRNLRTAAMQLHGVNSQLPFSTILGLLGRTIFACYLIDRKIINGRQFEQAGARDIATLSELFEKHDAERAKAVLYQLFGALQPKFNGSMFDDDLENEQERIGPEHMGVLGRFLRGDDLGTGQRTLGFWAYDFNFIPVETISAIYEKFLGLAEGVEGASSSAKRTSGSYYTPKHLAELVADTATKSYSSLLGKRVLDPACGSGIFLVTLFNRMAEEWRRTHPDKRSVTRWRALVKMLQNSLFGVDKDETACRLTCFSLYLALLDHFNPRDIQEFSEKGRLLPPLLLRENEDATADPSRTIICRNFFTADLPRIGDDFDIVIGNPPWVGRNQPENSDVKEWYAANVGQKLPGRQVAHAFMWKCARHVRTTGRVCLLLPSKVFLNRTDEFQEKWFKNHRVEEVLQLADLRFLLFENANCPAMAVRYTLPDSTKTDYTFDYISPLASRCDPRRGAVVILPEDRKRLQAAEIKRSVAAKEAPMLWKMFIRGTPRDIRLLERLVSYPKLNELVGTAKSPKRWISGQGIQPDVNGNTLSPKSRYQPKYPWWSESHLFVAANSPELDFMLLEHDCSPIGKPYGQYYFTRDPKLFKAPLLLVSQGFTKIAFAGFDVLFQAALQSIAAPEEDDAELLVFLGAVLRSTLAKYFFFHTAANWGTERDKVLKYELLQLPFPLPERTADPSAARGVVRKVHEISQQVKRRIEKPNKLADREDVIRRADREIEPLVFDYYDLDEYERTLVADTCEIVEPSATPASLNGDIATLREPTASERLKYAEMIARVMNSWAKRSKWKVAATTLASSSTGLGMVTLEKVNKTCDARDYAEDSTLQAALARMSKLLPRREGLRTYMRGLTVFDGNCVYITKPLNLRHWTRTAAMNDADALAAAILSSKRGATA